MSANAYQDYNQRFQTLEIKEKLKDIGNRALENKQLVNDVRAKALLQTTVDLIASLQSAYDDYEQKRKARGTPPDMSKKFAHNDMFF